MNKKVINRKTNKLSWKDFLPVVLAIPMAILIKIFVFTTYHVPTASMIPTIIPGDHILVAKWVFGPRIYFHGETYRLPGWRPIHRSDILVFNVPKEDSIFHNNREINYYNWKHSQAASPSPRLEKDSFQFMPIPGRKPFVKRVIGLPGDEFQYSSNTLLINDQIPEPHPQSYQFYELVFKNIADYNRRKDSLYQLGDHIQINRSERKITGIFMSGDLRFIKAATFSITPRYYFPDPAHIPLAFTWARCLASPGQSIRIPFSGWTVRVDSIFLSQYGQILLRFEGFKGRITSHFLLDENGRQIDQYTFKQNYYWAMGDNRPYSVDSRVWGLIPEDHIIGITRRTFWSKEPDKGFQDGFRWNRLLGRLD